MLGDGNEVATEEISRHYRDGIGRTRRDKLGKDGEIRYSYLTDADGNIYQLDHQRRTAATVPMMVVAGTDSNTRIAFRGEGITPERQEQMKTELMARRQAEARRATKSLGEREIEGLVATGRESRHEVPADAAGNLRPIEIVSEWWTSKDLRIGILQKSSDPRTGDTVTALSQIDRSEPDAALFRMPEGYRRVTQTIDVSYPR